MLDLLNVNFHTASAENAARVLDNFRRIESELNAPVLYICHNDVPNSCEGFTGGFTVCGTPGNDVHLCAPYFVSLTCEQRARALVHEAAHHIRGFLCGAEVYLGEPEYLTLPPERAMRNPDTYAQFANMVFRGTLSCRDCAAEIQKGSRR
ncbi:M35 family metallo-endopeptidase [Methanosarcina sp. Mfa9]|uniref:M35 family metallo-endopeptidase n=1 Tax=Methanosarcina sp. Mfa9 TaxID=3439063 RepID=UPI003F83D52A